MSQYKSQYPSVPVDPAVKKFFEEFYITSDTPEAHQKYADSFTDDATLTMATKTVKGKDEILAFRKGMWQAVSSRSHKPAKIFPFGPNSDEVMMYGTVAYGRKNGTKNEIDWAGRAHLVKENGEWKMDYYQVYLDTVAQQANQ